MNEQGGMKSFRDEIARHSSQAGAQRAPIMLSAPLLKLLLLATIDCASAAIFRPGQLVCCVFEVAMTTTMTTS